MFFFLNATAFDGLNIKSLTHVCTCIWFRWYKKDNSPWWNYFTEFHIFQSYPPVLKYIDCIPMNWTSETRDISWDHIQFLESLLPKICLSIKKNSHHINYRGSHSGVKSCIIKFLVCQCRCVFIFVVIKIMNMFNATINCYPCQIAILEISTMPVLSGFFMKLLPIIV